MLFRLYDQKANTLLTKDFVLTPNGDPIDQKEGVPLTDFVVQKGILIDEKPVFVGDAVVLNLKENGWSAGEMSGIMFVFGVARMPKAYDTIVIEVDTNGDDDGYSQVMFQLDGEFVQEPVEEGMVEGNYTIPMDGLSFVQRLLQNKTFDIPYNLTSSRWQQ